MSTTDKSEEKFFVGYAKSAAIPRRQALKIGGSLLVGAAGSASLLAAFQRPPGMGVWESDISTISGTLEHSPFPMLRMLGADGLPQAMLVVSEGKCSADSITKPFDSQSVEITGLKLRQNGYTMLEQFTVVPDQSVEKLAQSSPLSPQPQTLRGLLVDSKCFFGAMKPGYGLVHRGCARLCLRGGIPPMLVIFSNEQQMFMPYLLVDENRGLHGDALLEYAEQKVEISGILEQRDNFSYLRFSSDNIRVV